LDKRIWIVCPCVSMIFTGRGFVFALSYCYSRERRAMFARWRIREIRIRRNIAGFASAIRGAYELTACKFLENGELIP
jgi:hypothetical protein